MLNPLFPVVGHVDAHVVGYLTAVGEDWIGGNEMAEFIWLHYFASNSSMTNDVASAVGSRLRHWIDRVNDWDLVNAYYMYWDERVLEVAVFAPDELGQDD
jgi:hypothetical protein